tara:strand:- start:344 stop:835 length:492 start_codon:yes stop_codon:yes gene_type:complete
MTQIGAALRLPSLNPYSIVQSAVARGLLPDSARRQLARLGFQNPSQLLNDLYPRAVEEFSIQAFLEEQTPGYIPTPGVSMIDRELKLPWRNHYVGEVSWTNPEDGTSGTFHISTNSNRDLSIAEIEAQIEGEVQRRLSWERYKDAPEGSAVVGVQIVNAFRNR